MGCCHYCRGVATRVFLFTDVEGSTRLWSVHPNDMGAVLARHDELMQAVVSAAGGVVFKNTGDGMCAVFSSPHEALRAAVAGQRALAGADWGPVGQLRARMAVHAGEAQERDGDWFGPALNRSARLMTIGYGGQILVSGSVYELVCDGLDAGLSLIDLGTHRLRDLARAEHVWQLVGDGLQRSFGPLRSLDGTRGRLPGHLDSFVGREDELAVVVAELKRSRLVTLVGSGGMGKSRLAAHVGAELLDVFADGVWMFELAAVANADGLAASMIATLGLSGAPDASARDVLLERLRSERALLIIDNCEHLLEPIARLVGEMLEAGSGVAVLATSREPYGSRRTGRQLGTAGHRFRRRALVR